MKWPPCPTLRMSKTILLWAAVITSIEAVKSTSRSGTLAASGNGGGSPIVKAVEMLEGLQTKITDATKQEQDSYLKFTLWCQNESQATQFQIRSTEQKKAMFTADIAKSTADMAAASTHLVEIAQYESTDEADLKAATLLREKEAADFKALELELVNGIRTTQAAQVKLQQDIVAAGGEVAAGAQNAAFLQQKQPSKAMKAFSDVMVELTKAAALTSSDDMKTYPSLLEQLERSADGEVHFQKPQDAAVGTLQDNLQLLKDVEAKSQASLDAARAKEKRQQSDFLKLKNALSGKIKAMKQDLESTKKALADATATKANAEGEVAVCEQDIKTAKEFLVQVERGCMEKAGQFQQQKKNREDEVKAIMGALKALRGVMTSKRSKQSALSFLQLSSGRSKELHHLALRKVQQLAVAMQSPALNQLASKMTALARYGGEDVFVKMRKLIQEMISALEQTNREEMGKKAFCDQEMKHTKATLSDRQDESKRKSAALELTTAQVVESLDPLGRWPSFLRPIFCRKLLKSYIESAGRLRQTCLEILRKRKSEEQKDLNKDLLDRMLLDADPKTGQTMCEDSIVDNLLTFLFAGQDSTAAAMASCLCFLCSNPGCKERLLREIDEVVGDEAVSYEHLSQLQYLDWCIKETLRLMPPAAGALRDSTCEQVLGGWHIPAKAAIVVNTMTLHYRADLWGADVDQFKPERWEKGLPHKFAFMPFSHGPRACIGREFTLLEQKVTLVKFFQNLDIEQAPAEETAGYATLKADGRSPPFLKFDTQVKRDSAFLGLYTNFKLLPRTRAKDAVASH